MVESRREIISDVRMRHGVHAASLQLGSSPSPGSLGTFPMWDVVGVGVGAGVGGSR